ncbi:MAG: helix-turn-helix transcriptional regulator [Acidobacteria bacterium]|nr:helix-turn-helix transcriptional regulator [Acidobacteriota bacterium]MCH8990299.1 helix-turn-helix transcriptional regulator [Acidobacteriota bacterium]
MIRELRERAGLTQTLLAKLSGVSTRTISEYESGRGSPTLRMLARLATAAGVDVVLILLPVEGEDLHPIVLSRASDES